MPHERSDGDAVGECCPTHKNCRECDGHDDAPPFAPRLRTERAAPCLRCSSLRDTGTDGPQSPRCPRKEDAVSSARSRGRGQDAGYVGGLSPPAGTCSGTWAVASGFAELMLEQSEGHHTCEQETDEGGLGSLTDHARSESPSQAHYVGECRGREDPVEPVIGQCMQFPLEPDDRAQDCQRKQLTAQGRPDVDDLDAAQCKPRVLLHVPERRD